MCGIFGAIGLGYNLSIIRSLALINRERGTHSLGFLSGYSMFKRAHDPLEVLATKECNRFLKKHRNNWFILGHTRFATHGSITDNNAHPFRSGPYAGVHNGVVNAPGVYEVDSMYLWDRLNTTKGDWQAAWGSACGNWGLAWYDGRDIYLQAYRQVLAFQTDPETGVVYFSSDYRHLQACTGRRNFTRLMDGDTYRFTKGGQAAKAKSIEVNPPSGAGYKYGKYSRGARYAACKGRRAEYQSYDDWRCADEYESEKERFNPEPWWRAKWDKEDILTADDVRDKTPKLIGYHV